MYRFIRLFLTTFLILAALNQFSYADQFYYTWKDSNGTTHITDDINKVPKQYRNSSKKYKKVSNNYNEKLNNYYNSSKELIAEYKIYIILFILLIIVAVLYKKLIKKFKQKFLLKRIADNEKLILKSGINNMTAHQFKLKTRELFINNEYNLDETTVEYNPVVDYIAEKNGYKYALSINLNSNAIPRILINELEKEKYRYDCKYSMIVARTIFEEEAIRYAKQVKCELLDIYKIARIIVKNEKF